MGAQQSPVGNVGPIAGAMPGANPLKEFMALPGISELGEIGAAAKGQMPGATGGFGQPPSGQPWQTMRGIDTGYVGPTDAGNRLAILRAFGVT